MLIGGMDEAGRGPAIGPIVFGLVVITTSQEEKLRNFGVKDSKILDHSKRKELVEVISKNAEFYNTYSVSATQIDNMRANGITLNQIEVEAFRKLLSTFNGSLNTLQLDAADVNAERFGKQFSDMTDGRIESEHKGDSKFISVSAASIIAKVVRDTEIDRLQLDMKSNDPELPSFGSGYPTDAKPFLRAYVSKYRELPVIARASWKTCSQILDDILGPKQSSLDDFLN